MLGIAGLDPFGIVHAAIGIAAVALGLCVLVLQKGTDVHRKVGYAYVVAMLLLNGTALAIYDLFSRFGPFHVAAVVSLATLIAAYLPLLARWPRAWLHLHAHFMCWSYIGLIAAFIAEITVRVPSVSVGAAAVGGVAAAVVIGAAIVYRRLPQLIEQWVDVEGCLAADRCLVRPELRVADRVFLLSGAHRKTCGNQFLATGSGSVREDTPFRNVHRAINPI